MPSPLPFGLCDGESMSTPFEAWCAALGVRPDDPDAWWVYASGADQTSAVS